MKKSWIIYLILSVTIFWSCNQKGKKETSEDIKKSTSIENLVEELPEGIQVPEKMVWIPGGFFKQGATPKDEYAMNHEKPQHDVAVDGFLMDITEVTNDDFSKFVEETGYVTVAEREIDWENMKKQLPPGTPKPHDSILQPGSLTFKKTKNSVPNLYDYSQWWNWTIGANWKHPQGPESDIKDKGNYPVVHVAYEDALAYCEWAGRRLPTEAEWEYAAKGGLTDAIFSWGNDASILSEMANTWEGEFPNQNTLDDGFENKAPVKSYPPNAYGLYDMAGNVWEFTQDWFNTKHYNEMAKNGFTKNPKGADAPFNPNNPNASEKIIKGGSFLCSASYCASYRPSARMGNDIESSQEHLGFRTVLDLTMISEQK